MYFSELWVSPQKCLRVHYFSSIEFSLYFIVLSGIQNCKAVFPALIVDVCSRKWWSLVRLYTTQKTLWNLCLKTTPPMYLCSPLKSFSSMSGNNPVSYRLMIVDRPVLCHLRMHTRGCGGGGWGRRPNPRTRPRRALWHKKGSVGPPQFDAVVGHASKNLGVWLGRNTVFQLQPESL